MGGLCHGVIARRTCGERSNVANHQLAAGDGAVGQQVRLTPTPTLAGNRLAECYIAGAEVQDFAASKPNVKDSCAIPRSR